MREAARGGYDCERGPVPCCGRLPPRRLADSQRSMGHGRSTVRMRIRWIVAATIMIGAVSDPLTLAGGVNPDWSIARQWNEETLQAISLATPRPMVHARNLYHVSAAMYDAWAAYDPVARGVFFFEKHTAGDIDAARR